uniref:Phosphorylase b kinase regulatory subunit n=1 Tax=Heterorhabditis bacteriophora TaxID=37862 RepID=A0A1I7XSK7_HETBA
MLKPNDLLELLKYVGTSPYLWAQSLYVICCLLYEGFLSPAELDPLSRRLSVYEKRPPCEVQVTILAETMEVQRELRANGILVQRIEEIDPVFIIQPASALAQMFTKYFLSFKCFDFQMCISHENNRSYSAFNFKKRFNFSVSRIGQSKKLRLSGRPLDRDIGLLSTSRLYQIGQKFVIFTPQVSFELNYFSFMDSRRSHLMYDIRILMDEWSSELQYIYASWNSVSISGRPLVVLVVNSGMLTTVFHLVVMKNLSDFFRTTAVSKLEFHDGSELDLLGEPAEAKIHFALPTEEKNEKNIVSSPRGGLKRGDSVKDRWTYSLIHKASMRHRSIALDSNDNDLVQLRLAYKRKGLDIASDSGNSSRDPNLSHVGIVREKSTSQLRNVLKTISKGPENETVRRDLSQINEMHDDDLLDMLLETTVLEEQTSIVHCLWMKFYSGPNYDTQLNGQHVTVEMLMEEVYAKACECRQWALVRLTAGLLNKQLEELGKAVTHLLVRQKQLTVGMPSTKEEAITCPKTNEELKNIMDRAYADDPNAFTLSQEIIISLGSLVRTEPKLFVEMFRLRIGLIIQVLASELARIRNLSAADAAEKLLTISPFELKSMLFSLLSGRLLEEFVDEGDAAKDTRTGIGSFRRHIEERKSLRKSSRSMTGKPVNTNDDEDDGLEEDDFQFGIWLRHRRIDGALNRVPNNFYASLWDTVHRLPHGVRINDTVLHWGLTQEMTRREIKFALEVEEALNQIAEPEYREMVVETLWLLGRLDKLMQSEEPRIPHDRPLDVDALLRMANTIFVEHNKDLGTIVLDCCASGRQCDGARGICQHLYDSAPAGEYGSSHYLIKAMINAFT